MRRHAHVDFQLFSQKSSGIPELWCPFSCKLNSTKYFNPMCKGTLVPVALWECLSLLVRKLLICMKGSRMLWILPIGVVWATWTAKRYQFSDDSQLWLLMGWGFQVFHSHSQSTGAYRQPLQIFVTYLRKAFSGWFCFTSSVFSQGLFLGGLSCTQGCLPSRFFFKLWKMSRYPNFQKSVPINSKATITIALYPFCASFKLCSLSELSRSKFRSGSLISGNRYQCFGSSDHMFGSTRERTY